MRQPDSEHDAWWPHFARCGLTSLLALASGANAAEPTRVRPAQAPYPPAFDAPPPGPPRPLPPPGMARLTMRDCSWIRVEMPEPPKIYVNDIITIVVNETAESFENGIYNRQKNGVFKAQLNEFIRLNDAGNLAVAAENGPTIDSTLQSNMNNRAQTQTREGMKYRIAATVTDVLPNGTIVLEARKTIYDGRNVWEYQLTGRTRTKDIAANNTVVTEHVAELVIVKRQKGRVFDATRRGWLLKTYDFLNPF